MTPFQSGMAAALPAPKKKLIIWENDELRIEKRLFVTLDSGEEQLMLDDRNGGDCGGLGAQNPWSQAEYPAAGVFCLFNLVDFPSSFRTDAEHNSP